MSPVASPLHIDPASFKRFPHFSQAVLVSGPARSLYIAGQVAGDDLSLVASQSFEGQVHAVFDRIDVLLKEAGMGLSNLVKINGYISQRDQVVAYRKVVLERLGEIRPVSTLVIADLVDARYLVEIEATAVQILA